MDHKEAAVRFRWALGVVVALVASLVAVPVAAADAGHDGDPGSAARADSDGGVVEVLSYPVPGVTFASAITGGPDGNVWFTRSTTTDGSINRITPSGEVTSFTDTDLARPLDITSASDGNLWFAAVGGLGRVDPAGDITIFPVTEYDYFTGYRLTEGSDGNLWFTDAENELFGRMTPMGGYTFLNGPDIDIPNEITSGPDGNVWVFDMWTESLVRVTPEGVMTTFSDEDLWGLYSLSAGPDGNIWFTNPWMNSIGRITPEGAITMFDSEQFAEPNQITTGPDGNLWFTQGTNPDNAGLGRITPDGVVEIFTDPTIVGPSKITAGPDGNIWFTDTATSSIGVVVLEKEPPTVTIDNTSVHEGDTGTTELEFPVRLSEPSAETVTVGWATSSGDQPEVGVDYQAASGTVTFAPGQTEASVSVTVYGDTVDEPGHLWGAEWLAVTLSNPTGAQVAEGLGAIAFGLIVDDDPRAVVSIGDAVVIEGDVGTTELEFVVSLSEASVDTVAVDWATAGIHAEPGVDYEEASGTLTFAPGQTEAHISVTVYGDTVPEPGGPFGSEWMLVTLSNPSNAVLAGGWGSTGFGLIRDDD